MPGETKLKNAQPVDISEGIEALSTPESAQIIDFRATAVADELSPNLQAYRAKRTGIDTAGDSRDLHGRLLDLESQNQDLADIADDYYSKYCEAIDDYNDLVGDYNNLLSQKKSIEADNAEIVTAYNELAASYNGLREYCLYLRNRLGIPNGM